MVLAHIDFIHFAHGVGAMQREGAEAGVIKLLSSCISAG